MHPLLCRNALLEEDRTLATLMDGTEKSPEISRGLWNTVPGFETTTDVSSGEETIHRPPSQYALVVGGGPLHPDTTGEGGEVGGVQPTLMRTVPGLCDIEPQLVVLPLIKLVFNTDPDDDPLSTLARRSVTKERLEYVLLSPPTSVAVKDTP